MKRSEIKVGEAYYYDRSTNWLDTNYPTGHKAIVVDGERYAINTDVWRSREAPYTQHPKGTAVLVDVHHEDRHRDDEVKIERTAIPTAHLRGPWEATKAEVDARAAARRDRTNTAAETRKREEAAAKAIRDRAAQAGLKADYIGGYGSNTVRITMSSETAATLLDAYEQLHPKGE